jgi:methylated-DNA-[protein]-cysteine S-methyltransferase
MTSIVRYRYLDSPLGPLLVTADGDRLTRLYLPNHKGTRSAAQPQWTLSTEESDELLASAARQLAEYFAGERREFDLPLGAAGTPFQHRVWQQLVRIPYGTTISYRTLAERIGQPQAARAVGSANSRNPISIIVPCHRVIGSSGKLTGYAGGLHNKQWLLDWERRAADRNSSGQGYLPGLFDADESPAKRSPSIAANCGKS